MSSIKCDFCGSQDWEPLYRPIATKRDNRVCICNGCGLVFSTHDTSMPYSRKPNPSGDADWGNIRFCKTQRFEAVKGMLPPAAGRILDVGSSRGHFVKWARSQNPEAEIVAIEPDSRVTSTYSAEFNVIEKKLEDVKLFDNYFDFVYCNQTLEHVDSASGILRQIYAAMKPGGVLFLEVPNLEVIGYPLNIEEFFIDKHNFHFQKGVLASFMTKLGFDCLVNSDNLNVRIFATKMASSDNFVPNDSDPRELIKTYAENIALNREKLPLVVSKINRLMLGQKVAFWGANTMLDLMVKYGGLEPDKVSCLVDSFLWEYLDNLHGVPIQNPVALRSYQPDVCVVLARFSADEVAKQARRFGIRNVIKFSDILQSV